LSAQTLSKVGLAYRLTNNPEHGDEPVKKYPRNKDPNKRYEHIPSDSQAVSFQKYEQFCWDFIQSLQLPETWNVHVSSYALMEILVRVDRREAYYYYFHSKGGNNDNDGVDINERKLGGLYAYWILKLRPISVNFDVGGQNRDLTIPIKQQEDASKINEYFAVYSLYSWLSKWYTASEGKPFDLEKATNSDFHNALLYAFRYRNISIDAMMLLVESIVTETFSHQISDSH